PASGREARTEFEVPRPARPAPASVPSDEASEVGEPDDATEPEETSPEPSSPEMGGREVTEARPALAEDASEPAGDAPEVEPDVAETSGGPSPAPAPPRGGAAEDDASPDIDPGETGDGGDTDEDRDDSVAMLAPWLQVSRPVPPPREPQDPEDLARRHQGM